MEDELSELLQQGILVHNAGLVILNSYFKILFDRLGITENFTFKSTEDQLNAVNYLQYTITGSTKTEESTMTLNKVICGIAPTITIKNDLDISESDKSCGYWVLAGNRRDLC